MGIKYSEKYKVPFYESDTFKNMKISSLLAVALQISGEQSTRLGRSDVWIAEKFNYFWAIIEYELEMIRLPRFNEEITIETEASSYNNFFCYRHFWFRDSAGQLLIEIQTTWVLMDRDSRKIERVLDEIVAPYQSDKISKILKPHKFVKRTDFEKISEFSYPVRFSDLDMNGHVNNAKYYDWAADTLDFDFRKQFAPAKVYIKYNHEVRYGTDITVLTALSNQVSHHDINDASAQIEILWKKKV